MVDFWAHTPIMKPKSRYAVPVEALDRVRVPADRQVIEQAVHVDQEYLAPEDLDRARLLSITSAGRLHLR